MRRAILPASVRVGDLLVCTDREALVVDQYLVNRRGECHIVVACAEAPEGKLTLPFDGRSRVVIIEREKAP
jgi:hypothetical protein